MRNILKLYLLFLKIGVVNFGGGYAMLPLLQKEIVEKNGWATEQELNDYFAIGQCTPGAIAVNVSTFIGYKKAGILGGIFATLGFVTPALIIILIVASVLNNFSEYKIVQDAFAAIRVCVFVLILHAVFKLRKKSVYDIITLLIAITVFALATFTNVQLVFFVLAAGILGILINVIKEKSKKSSNKEEEK